MNWETSIKEFRSYLKLEKSLAGNSISAYLHDMEKLAEYMEMYYP
ncbi:MAG: site-specific integrase, partial [Chitinophagales bacterium]